MNSIKKYFFTIISIVFLFYSCDKIEEPYLEPIGSHHPEPGEKVRKILLEEFTGHTCVNCPEGSANAKNLKTLYGEQLILLSIHAGTNALPESEPFDADFRTVTGTEIHDYFNVSFYPGGIINRTKYSGQWTLPYTMWQEAVDEIINLLPEVYITIENDYNPSNRKLISTLTIEFLTDMEGTYNLCFYIAESGIIAAQKNDNSNYGPVPDILDYEHNHVLRTSVWGAWGTEVVSAGISQGETVTEYPSVTINNNWVADNCTVIAFIYNTETYNIIQAEEAAMIE